MVSGVKGSVGEVDGLVRRWKEVFEGLEAANLLLSVHKLLDEAHKAELDHDFNITAQKLAKVCFLFGLYSDISINIPRMIYMAHIPATRNT